MQRLQPLMITPRIGLEAALMVPSNFYEWLPRDSTLNVLTDACSDVVYDDDI